MMNWIRARLSTRQMSESEVILLLIYVASWIIIAIWLGESIYTGVFNWSSPVVPLVSLGLWTFSVLFLRRKDKKDIADKMCKLDNTEKIDAIKSILMDIREELRRMNSAPKRDGGS